MEYKLKHGSAKNLSLWGWLKWAFYYDRVTEGGALPPPLPKVWAIDKKKGE